VTIFAMRLMAAAVSVAVVLPACGTGSASDDAAVVRKADDAAAAAERSLEAVQELEAEVASLEDRLDDARRKGAALSGRLDKATTRLWDSLATLRASSGDASSSASSALATAQSASRDIAVLTQRLDYHLRQSGGE
jgi:chromosome segregation ATPase